MIIAAFLPQWAAAQVNYKSTMPDGKVIYGDKPAPGAVKVEEMKPPTTQGFTPPSAKEAGTLSDLQKSRETREEKSDRVRAAEQAVSQAEAALAAGKEPLAGERQGTATGAQRITDAYYERQKQLEANVARARAELDAARAAQ
jgi:hypothetical protein